jgi:hypothetical protein
VHLKSAEVPNMSAGESSGSMGVRTGQIIVRDVSEARLRTASPDCEIAGGLAQTSRSPSSYVIWRIRIGSRSRPAAWRDPCRAIRLQAQA